MQYNIEALEQQQLHHLVVDSLAKNNIRQAIHACRQLNQSFPQYFEGWLIAGEIHIKLKKPQAGLLSTERALALVPDEPRIMLQRVECLVMLKQIKQGSALLAKIAKNNLTKFNNVDVSARVKIIDQTAMFLSNLGLYTQALAQYKFAITLMPENASLYYNLAATLRFLGETDEALDALKICLKLNRLDFEGQGLRSSLKKQTHDSNHIDELKSVLTDQELPAEGKINICYALAKECDDINDTDQSFKYLEKGAAYRRQQLSYDVNVDIEIINAIQTSYHKELLTSGIVGEPSAEPIFIIGLPRTGTTLIERILSSHQAVFAAGELDNFGREMMKLLPDNKGNHSLSRANVVAQSIHIDFAQLGKNYLSSTRPLTGHTEHFIDKLPFNYLYAGLIHLALPNAKIINVFRHPMAACYAIYKQLFRDAYPFSYDLKDLGNYYIAYHQLIQHWKNVMPGVMYDIRYEDVVTNTEEESKKLLAFCNLDWQEQCLRFYENKQVSTTASASQVRKPIYSSSIERWKLYSKQLKPLEDMLVNAGIDVGKF